MFILKVSDVKEVGCSTYCSYCRNDYWMQFL